MPSVYLILAGAFRNMDPALEEAAMTSGARWPRIVTRIFIHMLAPALLAAAGLAIGAAWSGLLSNFAAGAFLVLLRPFKVGDMITAGGVTGDVEEVGLFVTALKTVDNLRVYVGNSKIFSDNIVNYTHNPYRRVDLKCQLAHTVDPREAIAKLKMRLPQIANVVATPAPDVEILEFNAAGTLLGVRPYYHNNDYWQVFFDTNKAIQEVGATNV